MWVSVSTSDAATTRSAKLTAETVPEERFEGYYSEARSSMRKGMNCPLINPSA